MSDKKGADSGAPELAQEVVKVFLIIAVFMAALVIAMVPVAMRFSIEKSRNFGVSELRSWISCLCVAVAATAIPIFLLGIPHIYSGYVAVYESGPALTKEQTIKAVVTDLEGQIKILSKKMASKAASQDVIYKEAAEYARERDRELENLRDNEYDRERKNELLKESENKTNDFVERNNKILAGVEKVQKEMNTLNKSIGEHEGYLDGINSGRSVATPYDDYQEKFKARRDAIQAKYLHYWAFFLLLVAVGLVGCLPRNEYFHGAASGGKNKGMMAVLYVGGVTCYYLLWPISKILELGIQKIFRIDAMDKKVSNDIIIGEGRIARLTEHNLAYHVQVVGGSGAGKTNLLKLIIEDRVRKGRGVVFFDFKADFDVLRWLSGVCLGSGRKLAVVSLSDLEISSGYNPLAVGDATELCSQLMNSLRWSEPFYRDNAEKVLQAILGAFCHIRDHSGELFHLGHIVHFLQDSNYRNAIVSKLYESNFVHSKRVEDIALEISDQRQKDRLSGLINQLEKIIYSSAGPVVTSMCQNDGEIDLLSALNGEYVLYLYMNSLKLKETASVVGKMMLQDLMKVVGSLYGANSRLAVQSTVVIDEFASFATPDFIHLLDKARGAGISIVLAHQSRSDLKEVTPNFAERIEENTASKVIFQVQSGEDAEFFSSMIGTYTKHAETEQVSDGLLFGDSPTGMKSRREVEAFEIHPNEFKRLGVGEAVLICRKIDPHHGKIKIIKANDYGEDYHRIDTHLNKRHYASMECKDSGEGPRGGFSVV